jgi:hypothetical protein
VVTHCSSCGCDGPSVPDEYGAVMLWNVLYDYHHQAGKNGLNFWEQIE